MGPKSSTEKKGEKSFGGGLGRSVVRIQCISIESSTLADRPQSKMISNASNKSSGTNGSANIELRDRTNAKSSTPSSSFLPELNSTPPLPTFQRGTTETTNIPPPRRQPRPESSTLPPIADPGFLATPRRPKVIVVGLCGGEDRPEGTPKLPKEWSEVHDRAICAMEVRGYLHEEMIAGIRGFFPEIKNALMVGMIDKRIRQLDQIPEIDYFKQQVVEEEPRGLDENSPIRERILRVSRPVC